ncbi:MAG: UDP-N-acetylglucosamine 2-epimerase (non-hydrolyzing) [Oscillospiraceae bacterium]|nr:UDP-N-acetylglucosamine 2-epimerase (non-hydrolyzing) [Candidatus Ruminococcus equi]
MKKIMTIVGARPQFIKAAMMSRVLKSDYNEVLVHTGQHYDKNMSDVFFDELNMSPPDYNLNISGGTHGTMTGRMMISLEEVMLKEKPDMVIVYGDTNSTMAGALVAVKLGIPVAHIEAGNTRGSLSNPEDINRLVSDHTSSILFACVESAMDVMKKENLSDRAYFVGDSMLDAFLYYSSITDIKSRTDYTDFDGNRVAIPDEYYYMTCHRQENAETKGNLLQILLAAQELDSTVIYAVHPRNRKRVTDILKEHKLDNIVFINPVGYLSSVALMNNAKKVITDSGGLQREAFFANKQCVTVFNYAWWPETLHNGMNRLVKPDKNDILEKLSMEAVVDPNYKPFGDGHSCEKMKEIIDRYFA